MNILKFPDPFLFEETELVTVFGEELKVLLDSMYDTMKANNGVGLAANQVGLTLRAFVMDGPNGRLNVLNPRIVSKSFLKANVPEGCLSSPGNFVVVRDRAYVVDMKFQNELGEHKQITLERIHAVAAQHEIEHLDGKSFMENKSIPNHVRKNLKKKWGIK